VIDPLEMEFTVACSPEHAWDVWATKTSLWWPRDHSVSGEEGLSVTIEPRCGGRIYERTPRGLEHDWGEVVAWEPPHRLVYLWHIGRDRSAATEVAVTFAPARDITRVTIVHRGWERLGADAGELRNRNRRGWASLLPHFERECGELSV
jgi:uncharacterized protein YndB with AHSA1/START domain